MSVHEVIECYRNAGEEERLELFLAYRELREAFSSIDDDTLAGHPRRADRWMPLHGQIPR